MAIASSRSAFQLRHKIRQQVVSRQLVFHPIRNGLSTVAHQHDRLHRRSLTNLLLQVCHGRLFQEPVYACYIFQAFFDLLLILSAPKAEETCLNPDNFARLTWRAGRISSSPCTSHDRHYASIIDCSSCTPLEKALMGSAHNDAAPSTRGGRRPLAMMLTNLRRLSLTARILSYPPVPEKLDIRVSREPNYSSRPTQLLAVSP